jgi:hypothetical protein
MLEVGTEATQFPEKEHINGIFVAVCTFDLKAGEKRSVHLDQIAAQPLDGNARHHYLI